MQNALRTSTQCRITPILNINNTTSGDFLLARWVSSTVAEEVRRGAELERWLARPAWYIEARMWARTARIVTTFVSLVVGCKAEHEAAPAHADLVLARDAFHRFDVVDACRGGGKLNFCTTEKVTAIEKVVATDTNVIQVLDNADLPAPLTAANAAFALHGDGAGATRLKVDARFDDGSLRTTELSVSVVTPDSVDVGIGCSNPDVTDRTLFRAGAESVLSVTLRREQTELGGVVLAALKGEGLVPAVGSLERTAFAFTAPNEPATIAISSGIVSDFSLSLRVFSPDEVEVVSLDSRLPKPLRLTRGTPAALTSRALVAGKVPCQELSLRAETRSPEVCVGPNDETEWSEATPGNMRIKPLTSGSCDLRVAVVDATKTFDFSVSYELKE